MPCPPKIKIRHKIVIGGLIGFAISGGVAALLVRYFENFSDLSQVVSKNPVQQQAVNLARLGETYKTESAKIISGFLAAAGSGDADAAALADQAQKKLLSLSLPAEFRQRHLSEVLLLGEIRAAAAAGKTAELSLKISELKRMTNQE